MEHNCKVGKVYLKLLKIKKQDLLGEKMPFKWYDFWEDGLPTPPILHHRITLYER